MPRRNFYLIWAIAIVSILCFYRGRSGRITDTFLEVYREIEDTYVEDVDPRELLNGALEGMVSELDRYSSYISPEEYIAFKQSMDQEFGGIGIEVTIDPESGRLMVKSPLVGTPAYNQGVLPGDLILEINGESTEGMKLEDTVKVLRGRPGEAVTITVQHKGEEETEEIEIVRAKIAVDSVRGDLRTKDQTWDFFVEGAEGIGYIRVTGFTEKTVAELRQALLWLQSRGMRGLILDLRDNPGGQLVTAVETCDMFISEGEIVSTRKRHGVELETYHASSTNTFKGFPMVVLVNKYSASASEIVAACLQDHDRAVVVGERTWGKGSVQNVVPLEGGRSALKLTIAHFYRPNGHNIHRTRKATEEDEWGVQPNEGFTVELTEEQEREWRQVRRDRDVIHPNGTEEVPPTDRPYLETDPVLQRGVEYLESLTPEQTAGSEEGAEGQSG